MDHSAAAESLLRDMRAKLAFAHQLEISGAVEFADAAGAVAANKLAQALRVSDRVAA